MKTKYTLQILKDSYLKKTNLLKYNLRVFYEDKKIISTNNKSELKIYIDLLGIKTKFKNYQISQIAGYLFYE